MPQGNAISQPTGIWHGDPVRFSIPYMMLRTCFRVSLMGTAIAGFWYFRVLARDYTYTEYIGKTISLGKLSVLTHEPLSVAEIDKLKAEEAARKK